MELEKLLYTHFGYHSFKPGQLEVISSLKEGNHTLAMLPTGTGKSLCYQLPGYFLEGTVLIVSPLLSLMQDQVEQMMRFGEKRVIAINSFLTSEEKQNAFRNIKKYKFIFLSPEMLHVDAVMQILKGINLSLFVVDEAHCISQWGYDFRPDYLKLGEIRKSLGNPLTLALTATATEQVREDIIVTLGLEDVRKVISSVDRPNIALHIQKFGDYRQKQGRLIELVKDFQIPGIVYFSSKKAAEQSAFLLRENGVGRVMAYHGGMDQEQRILIQQQFINGQLDVICATSAFGMGVNKENIRFVIHYHMPMQIESYLQEIGRAGRDGEPSIAVLLYGKGDEQLPLQLMERELPTEQQIDWLFYQLKAKEGDFFPLDERLMHSGGFTETQWRFIVEFTERFRIEKEDHENIKKMIKEYIGKRNQVKRENLFQVKKWIDSDDCRRDFLLHYFQEPANRNVKNCCDYCGIAFTQYKIKSSRNLSENIQDDWLKYLAKILLV